MWRHLINLAHNLLIYVLIAVVYGMWPTWQTLLVIPGILLVSINGMSFGMLLGTLCASRWKGYRHRCSFGRWPWG